MKTFEEQCEELQMEIKQLETSCITKNRELTNINQQIEQSKQRLQKYLQKEEYFKQLERA